MDAQVEIPNKSLFKFHEVTTITDIKPYVLRFWESEFQEISPIIGETGQKLYEPKDIEVILQIKKCLFEDKLSILEAKKEIWNQSKQKEQEAPEQKSFDLSMDDAIVTEKSPFKKVTYRRALSSRDLKNLSSCKKRLKECLNIVAEMKKHSPVKNEHSLH